MKAFLPAFVLSCVLGLSSPFALAQTATAADEGTGTDRVGAKNRAPLFAQEAPDTASAPVPSAEDRKAMAEALETIRRVSAVAMRAIEEELRARRPDLDVKSSHGGFIKNDYRAYQWIEVHSGGREYWITAVYNDLDFSSGNFHSQYGRIQFWRDIQKAGKRMSTPNDRVNGWWRPRMDRQWRKLPPTFVWKDDFSAQRVVDLFLEFIGEE